MNNLLKTSSLLLCLAGFINCHGAPEKIESTPTADGDLTTASQPKSVEEKSKNQPNRKADETSSIVTEEQEADLDLTEVIEESESVNVSTNKTSTAHVISEETASEKIINEEVVIEEEVVSEPVEVESTNGLPSHAVFNSLLKKYVSASGKVNYVGLKSEKSTLVAYCNTLSSNPPQSSWSKNDKLAYWINVYNAFTIKLILDKWPVNSIMDINGGKAWDLKIVKVGSTTYSLNQVENEIIRPRFKEPRIHFAVNCAAISCPKLLNEAYEGSTLNAQLEKSSKYFVNNTSKNKLSASSVQISKIFEWYGEDFKAGGGIIAFLNKYSTTKINANAKISYLEYKWALNNK